MGYRSTIVSQDRGEDKLPKWFKDKYEDMLLFPSGMMIVSKKEAKYYDKEVFEDYRKAIMESDYFEVYRFPIEIIVLAEDGVLTKVIIHKNGIDYYSVFEFDDTEGVWNQGD